MVELFPGRKIRKTVFLVTLFKSCFQVRSETGKIISQKKKTNNLTNSQLNISRTVNGNSLILSDRNANDNVGLGFKPEKEEN